MLGFYASNSKSRKVNNWEVRAELLPMQPKIGNLNPEIVMTYPQALQVLFDQLPMFQRQGAVAFKKDLTNTVKLCKYFDDPHTKFKSVHIAGTNGKGSVSHFLASILQEADYKVGLYTSPHLKDFRERIKVNGEMIPEEKVIRLVENHLPNFSEIKPSFFEMTVALAFHHFAEEKVDIAIVETGLGGRLDSTNVINPELSIITNIGYDHQQFLGETLQEIAGEKAGIIKYKVPTLIGRSQPETNSVFILKTNQLFSTIQFVENEMEVVSSQFCPFPDPTLSMEIRVAGHPLNLNSPVAGAYQVENIRTAVAASTQLIQQGWKIELSHIQKGVSNVIINTGFAGRWQKIGNSPTTICDCGHNMDGISEISKMLDLTPHQHLHFVIGMVGDKDLSSVLTILPKNASYYFCAPDIPRALDVDKLASKAKVFGLIGSVFLSVSEALRSARKVAGTNDLVFVGGSTFVVAEVV